MTAHLDYFSRPVGLTDAGSHATALDALPDELADLVRIVQGLVIYDVIAKDFYGYAVPPRRTNELHIRPLERLIGTILDLDKRPLDVARSPGKRVVGRCHHFVLLLVGMLRAKGVPARARCGFGGFFNPGFFEDHWVCEYWTAAERRWKLADPQFDAVWRAKLKIDHDVLDVPRDRFLVAGDAWARCRAGEADASKFGIEFEKLRGLWFVAGDLMRDLASLNKVEMLPWDVWGAMPRPNAKLGDQETGFFERIADRTRTPDDDPAALRALYDDDGLRVPDEVFNALLNREEAV